MFESFLSLLNLNIDDTKVFSLFFYVSFITVIITFLVFTSKTEFTAKRLIISISIGIVITGINYALASNYLHSRFEKQVKDSVVFDSIEPTSDFKVSSLISKKDGKSLYSVDLKGEEGYLISNSDYLKPKSDIKIDAYMVYMDKDNISKPLLNLISEESKNIINSLNNKILLIEE